MNRQIAVENLVQMPSKRDRLCIDVTGLRDRLRAQSAYPNQSLASVIRILLVEALGARESKNVEEIEPNSDLSVSNDKNDISTIDNGSIPRTLF